MEKGNDVKKLRKFFADGGGSNYLSLSYYSPDVDAKWIIDIEDRDSLQMIYRRKSLQKTYDPKTMAPKENDDEDFWLYLAPQDAAVIGAVLMAWAAAHGEKA